MTHRPNDPPTNLLTLHVPTTVHGRILVRPAFPPSAPVLAIFHGYGSDAMSMLDAVHDIPGISDWHIVAIQALHPFYARRTNAVVASWMTSQDRDLTIADNVAYVSRAIDAAMGELTTRSTLVCLGFSQGTAMAYRAACLGAYECDAVIALGGDVPAEIEDPKARRVPRVLIGRGTADDWYTEDKLEKDLNRLSQTGALVETCIFDGGHEWTDVFRTAAGAFLGELI